VACLSRFFEVIASTAPRMDWYREMDFIRKNVSNNIIHNISLKKKNLKMKTKSLWVGGQIGIVSLPRV